MVSTAPIASQPIPQPVGEKRMVFRSFTWQKYQAFRATLAPDRNNRLIYTDGILEVTMPLEIHEFSARLIGLFIRILVVELDMDLKTMGSTTLEQESLEKSAEPDAAYYIQNQPLVAGRDVNLASDPPPDLVVEVDITHTDINKLRLYAAMGIPEFWRYNGEIWRIYCLQKGEYQEVQTSPTFPLVEKAKLYEFLSTARQSETTAERELRAWVRSL